jgi:hypothetical protein
MKRVYLLALGVALCATSNLLADGPAYTQIDFPGAASTQAWGITANGGIAGAYVSVDNSTHSFLRTRGEFISIDFPGAAYTYVNGISPRGDVLGSYSNSDNLLHTFVMSVDPFSPGGRFEAIDDPVGATQALAIGIRGDDIVGG